jgi:hypothetical protein
MFEQMRKSLQGLLSPTPAAPMVWKQYDDPSAGFQISFPAPPTPPKDTGNSSEGTYFLQVSSKVGLLAFFNDYGPEVGPADEVLAGARDGGASNVGARIVSERRIALDGYPGIAFESESDSNHYSSRTYLAGSVLYLTLVITSRNEPYAEADRFHDSFKIISRVQG